MPNDKHSDIISALRVLLASITTGSEYWFTPSVVAEADGAFMNDLQNNAFEHVILISSGDEFVSEEVGEIIEHTWEVFIAASRKWQTLSDPMKRQRESRVAKLTIQNRMLHDIEKVIMSDVQLGGLVDNAIWPRAEVNRNFSMPEGRATLVIRLEIQFSLTRDTL